MDINGNPTVISTFAGTGGSSLGYHWAGFKELLAIDFDEDAVQCFKANFPNVPIWHKSVTQITGKEIMDFCKINPGELDVFDGSPPCQGFSTAGKRVVSDPRNDLFAHYYRLVCELQPKVFIMENVSGMIKGSMKGKFIEIMNVLKSGNYIVKAKLMNAMYYGVPQSRQRMIFIGVRKDLNKMPLFPTPSKNIITAGMALEKVKDIGYIEEIKPFVKKIFSRLKPGENVSKYNNGNGFGFIMLHPRKPAPTLLKSDGNQFYHWSQKRVIGLNELKILCSFPEDWSFPNRKIGINRLGNAVMPKMMQAIAETIKKDILFK